jgi:hypothetical protein
MIKLSGWKRIGIIGSVVWILGAGFYTLNVSDSDIRFASSLTLSCENSLNQRLIERQKSISDTMQSYAKTDTAPTKQNLRIWEAQAAWETQARQAAYNEREAGQPECDKRSTDYLAEVTTNKRIEAIPVALIPVSLGWGFVYLVLFLVRWVRHGFVPLL